MTSVRTRALEIRQLIERDQAAFAAMPDMPGQKIHCLYAGLYRETIIQWLRVIEEIDAPVFTHLVVRRFYEIYEASVPDHLKQSNGSAPRPWRKYQRLARRLTLRSPISAHLLLLALGVRAHVRHDLSDAISHAAYHYRQHTGKEVDFENERPNIIGRASAQAFFSAALNYVEFHRSQRHGWRYLTLSAYGLTLRALRPIWVDVLEGWRREAWAEALAESRAARDARLGQART